MKLSQGPQLVLAAFPTDRVDKHDSPLLAAAGLLDQRPDTGSPHSDNGSVYWTSTVRNEGSKDIVSVTPYIEIYGGERKTPGFLGIFTVSLDTGEKEYLTHTFTLSLQETFTGDCGQETN